MFTEFGQFKHYTKAVSNLKTCIKEGLLKKVTFLHTYIMIVFPHLISFQMMTFDHHDRSTSSRYIQAYVITAQLLVSRICPNLQYQKEISYMVTPYTPKPAI